MKKNKYTIFLIIMLFISYIIIGCSGKGGSDTQAPSDIKSETKNTETGIVSGRAFIPLSEESENISIILESNSELDKSFRTVTDNKGSYIFSGIPSGNYKLLAAKGEIYRAEKRNIIVNSNGTTSVTIELMPSGNISGTVGSGRFSFLTAQNLSKSLVFIEGTSYISVADDNGAFQIFNVPVGTYKLTVMTSSYPVFSGVIDGVTVNPGETTSNIKLDLDTSLSTGQNTGELEGIIKNSNNAAMQAMLTLSGYPFVAMTDNSGYFKITGIPEGLYEVVIIGINDDSAIDKKVVNIIKNQINTLNVTMEIVPGRPFLKGYPNYVTTSPIVLEGYKEANTSIYINNELSVPLNAQTDWYATKELTAGYNVFKILSKDGQNHKSDDTKVTIYYVNNNSLAIPTISSDLETSTEKIIIYGAKDIDTSVEILSPSNNTVLARFNEKNTSWHLELSNLAVGYNNFNIRGMDNSGGYSNIQPFIVVRNSDAVITEAPAMEIQSAMPSNISYTSADINVYTNIFGFCRIAYGTASNNLIYESSITSVPAKVHKITLNGLMPGTMYYFKAIANDFKYNETLSSVKSFTTDTGASLLDGSSSLSPCNKYIDITFSEAVWGDIGNSSHIDLSDFNISYIQNGEPDITVLTGLTVKQNDNEVSASASILTGGETTVRMWLSTPANPSNGTGTVTLSVKPDSIYGSGGVPVTSAVTITKTLNNTMPPAIDDIEMAVDNSYVTITFDKPVYGNNTATIPFGTPAAFSVNYDEMENDSVTSITIGSITDSTGSATNAGDTVFRLYLNLSPVSTSTGDGVISLEFTSSYVYNEFGFTGTGNSNTVNLRNTSPPNIIDATLIDNNYIDITFDKPVYGNGAADSPVNSSTFNLSFSQNSDTLNGLNILEVKANDSNTIGTAGALIGGETNVRLFFARGIYYGSNGLSNGAAEVIVEPANNSCLYNSAGIPSDSGSVFSSSLTFKNEEVSFEDSISNEYIGPWHIGSAYSKNGSIFYAGASSLEGVNPQAVFSTEFSIEYKGLLPLNTSSSSIYAFKVYAKTPSNSASIVIECKILWFQDDGITPSSTPSSSGEYSLSSDNIWEQIGHSDSIPGDAAYARCVLNVKETDNGGNTIYFDSVSFGDQSP